MRIWLEDANGLRSSGQGAGHVYFDVTDNPFPTIQAGRPVRYYVTQEKERERERGRVAQA